MKSVTVLYHFEDGVWWADSADIPGWSAAGDTFDAVRDQVYGGVQEFAGPAVIFEVGGELMTSGGRPTATSSSRSASVQVPTGGDVADAPSRALQCS